MSRTITPLHAVAATVGAGLIGTDMLSNVEYMLARTQTMLDSSILAVIMVAIGSTIALAAAIQAYRQRHIIVGTILVFGFLAATAFSLSATLDRVASTEDARNAKMWAQDAYYARLGQIHDHQVQAASKECFRFTGRSSRGEACVAAEKEVAISAERLRARGLELHSLGNRLSAITPLSVEQVITYVPLLLPIALLILGQWLFAFGVNGQVVAPEFSVLDEAAEQEERAKRFVSQYLAQYGRRPALTQITKASGLGQARARRVLASV